MLREQLSVFVGVMKINFFPLPYQSAVKQTGIENKVNHQL